MLSKKEAYSRLYDIAEQIGATNKSYGIRDLRNKYQLCRPDDLATKLVEQEFGLKDVQWFHTEWDWLDLEWRGKFYIYFKAIIPDFNNGQPVYLQFYGEYDDGDSEWDYIEPVSIYTQADWEAVRQRAVTNMQVDSYLAAYLATN